MTTTERTSYRVGDATSPLWFGRWPGGWGDVVHGVEPGGGRSASAMIDAAGLASTVEQHPLEAVLGSRMTAVRRGFWFLGLWRTFAAIRAPWTHPAGMWGSDLARRRIGRAA